MACCNQALCYAGVASLVVGLYYVIKFVRSQADLKTLGKSIKVEKLNKKVVLVTGSSSGIGEELVKQINAHGGYVVMLARREAELKRVQGTLAHPENSVVITLDLVDIASHAAKVKEIMDAVKAKWGRTDIDILVNNGGRSQRGLVEEHMDDMEYERTLFEVNFFGTVSFTKIMLKEVLMPAKKGRIAFVTSVSGKMGSPVSASYAATKHALQGWADSLRAEVGSYGITVYNICPGPVATPIEKSVIRGKTAGEGFSENNTDEGKMAVEAAGEIMLKGLTNDDVYETWVSPQPVLFFVYLFIYLPSFAQMISKKVVQKRIDAYKYGTSLYGTSFLDNLKATLFGKKKED